MCVWGGGGRGGIKAIIFIKCYTFNNTFNKKTHNLSSGVEGHHADKNTDLCY